MHLLSEIVSKFYFAMKKKRRLKNVTDRLVETRKLRAKFQTVIVSCPIFILLTQDSLNGKPLAYDVVT